MRATNAERANLIDALALAIEFLQSLIDSNLPTKAGRVSFFRPLTKREAADYAEWRGQIKRYRVLRRRLLKEERES